MLTLFTTGLLLNQGMSTQCFIVFALALPYIVQIRFFLVSLIYAVWSFDHQPNPESGMAKHHRSFDKGVHR